MKKVAIVIPFYRIQISDYEKIALKQCEKVLGNHDKIAIKPMDLNLPDETKLLNLHNTISFSNNYFESISGYNKLMLSAEFYKAFLNYEYILIYQMDCFVFSDQLDFWCNQNWDYIGAPWIRKTYHKNPVEMYFLKIKQNINSRFNCSDNNKPNQYQLNNQVGNGGFSLRRVHKFYNLCLLMQPVINEYLSSNGNLHNEDVFWSIEVNKEKRVLNIPSCEKALKFAVEVPPIRLKLLKESDLPFGCHDWDRYADYWRIVFSKIGYKI
ncbi:DUF5672 family protein [Pedobacter alluvionis]|uniref:DUF5672 domain-containing protein n=1 Tax=Pedobacter alluvionis TaxID=475253 RepID=A0A497Y6S5_9SPHI|nr:DUF5672 family protein [Pedobacter alluvionis]RLJ77686.1 hypothetical protein BCL90_2792 [Pedobacter alluvionis]TFB33112.1 hypothetical protein E3V97_03455 [Pedobacter alluvionis]